MTRMLFFLSLLLFSSASFATGKLILKPSFVTDDQRAKYMLGLVVHEKISGSLFYAGQYLGGSYDRDTGESWYKTSQGVDYWIGPVSLAAGVSYQFNPETEFDEKEIYSSLSITLW